MKKLVLFALVSLLSVSAFAQIIPNTDKIIEDFYKRGKYIKVVKDESNIAYFNKETVQGFFVDENEFTIVGGFNAHTSKIDEGSNFGAKKWSIEADEDGNIIITNKTDRKIFNRSK